MQVRPRRSVLYMPGANKRALEKAKTLPADSLILDLEDSVAPEAKAEARDSVCAAVKAGGYGHRELVVRLPQHDDRRHEQERCEDRRHQTEGIGRLSESAQPVLDPGVHPARPPGAQSQAQW